MWMHVVASGSDFRSLMLPPRLESRLEDAAFADACADTSSVGWGGSANCSFRIHQKTFARAELRAIFPWLPSDCSLQKLIVIWESAAQEALLLMLHELLGVGHLPCHTVFILRSGNSASESTSWKGLCHALRSFFMLQERLRNSAHVDRYLYVSLYDTADPLGRGSNPSDLGFKDAERSWWIGLCSLGYSLRLFQSRTTFEGFLAS